MFNHKEFGLQEIKERYQQYTVSKNICYIYHHLDCAIFRSLEQYEFCFCSCGLLHDLEKNLSDTGLVEIVYPRYWHDYYLQENGTDSDEETLEMKILKEKEKEECERILLETFGPPDATTLSEIKANHEEDKKLLYKVFGKEFNNIFLHLEQRLVEKIEEHRKYASYKSVAAAVAANHGIH